MSVKQRQLIMKVRLFIHLWLVFIWISGLWTLIDEIKNRQPIADL